MKMLIATAALVTLIASPVLAQSVDRQATVRPNNQTIQAPQFGGNSQRHSTNPAHDVYDNAHNYLGSDPSALVRLEIQRDRATAE
jgi:hypothetical protein